MDTTILFTQALGISDSWYVDETKLIDTEDGKKEMHIYLNFYKSSRFKCPCDDCEETNTAYDTFEKVWRHPDFFQHKTYMHADVPRVKCSCIC